MTEVRRTGIQPLLISALFVLLLPPLLLQGTTVLVDFWPAIGEVDELLLMSLESIIVAVATVTFLFYIEIDSDIFAIFSIIAPFVSIWIIAEVVGNGIHGVVLLFVATFFAVGSYWGLLHIDTCPEGRTAQYARLPDWSAKKTNAIGGLDRSSLFTTEFLPESV